MKESISPGLGDETRGGDGMDGSRAVDVGDVILVAREENAHIIGVGMKTDAIQTDHQQSLWDAYTRALTAHQARPSDEAARLRLIASYARFCEAFDPVSAQENIQSLIWRLQKVRAAA